MRNRSGLVCLMVLFVGSWFFQTDLVSAQDQSGTLTVLVKDPTGATVAGAKLIIISAETVGRAEVQTDENGCHAFQGLVPGNYRMTVEASGFLPLMMEKTVAAGENGQLEAVLQVGGTYITTDWTQVEKLETTIGPPLQLPECWPTVSMSPKPNTVINGIRPPRKQTPKHRKKSVTSANSKKAKP